MSDPAGPPLSGRSLAAGGNPSAPAAAGGGASPQQSIGSQVAQPAALGGGVVLKPLPYRLTMPPPDDFYFVRKDQLDGLTENARDHSFDIAVGAGGAAIGFAQNFLSVVKSISAGTALDTIDLILGMAAVGFTVLAITKYLQYKGNKGTVEILKARIESGQKAQVGNEAQGS
jgi:hypothetical protein